MKIKKEYEIAEDLCENFEKITGYNPKNIVDLSGEFSTFDEGIVDETASKLKKYASKKYGENILITNVFTKLDNMLLEATIASEEE